LSKVETGTGTVKNFYGSTTLLRKSGMKKEQQKVRHYSLRTCAAVNGARIGIPAHLNDAEQQQPIHDRVAGTPGQVGQRVVVPARSIF
jgi:hypothetical protein